MKYTRLLSEAQMTGRGMPKNYRFPAFRCEFRGAPSIREATRRGCCILLV